MQALLGHALAATWDHVAGGRGCNPTCRSKLDAALTCNRCDAEQAKTADGDEARYMASSAAYLRYYASALRSAREHAPSLLPVLVVLNDMPAAYTAWVEAQVRGHACTGRVRRLGRRGAAPPVAWAWKCCLAECHHQQG